MSSHSKVIAQTDTQTGTQTHRHDENISSFAFEGGKNVFVGKSIHTLFYPDLNQVALAN